MQHQFRLMLSSPSGIINFQYKLKNITGIKINKIRYFQNTVGTEMLICLNGFTQQVQNQSNINYTVDYELTYLNTFGIYYAPTQTLDYENIEDPKDVNYINYVIYVDGQIATTTQISTANPLYINLSFLSI